MIWECFVLRNIFINDKSRIPKICVKACGGISQERFAGKINAYSYQIY